MRRLPLGARHSEGVNLWIGLARSIGEHETSDIYVVLNEVKDLIAA